jgi:hypothetical protein
MSRRTPPQVVEVYYPGESTKLPSKLHMLYEEADKIHAARKGIFRDQRRKIVLATRPSDAPSGGRSVSVGKELMHRYVEAVNSGRDRAAIVAVDLGWGRKEVPRPQTQMNW